MPKVTHYKLGIDDWWKPVDKHCDLTSLDVKHGYAPEEWSHAKFDSGEIWVKNGNTIFDPTRFQSRDEKVFFNEEYAWFRPKNKWDETP